MVYGSGTTCLLFLVISSLYCCLIRPICLRSSLPFLSGGVGCALSSGSRNLDRTTLYFPGKVPTLRSPIISRNLPFLSVVPDAV